jgi:hypothetical protein
MKCNKPELGLFLVTLLAFGFLSFMSHKALDKKDPKFKVGECFSILGLGLGKVVGIKEGSYDYITKYASKSSWQMVTRDGVETVDRTFPKVDCDTYKYSED